MQVAINTRNLSIARILADIYKTIDFQDEVIRLVTEVQLEEQGVDGKGRSLGEYADFTKNIRSALGLRIDHVTLKLTGEYYESHSVKGVSGGFVIISDSVKDAVTDLADVYGEDIVGLNENSIAELSVFLIDEVRERTRKKIFANIR